MVQNTAARVLCRVGKYDHITATLKRLHWLHVEFRIKYKVCMITFNALFGNGPAYIRDMLMIIGVNYGLRSINVVTLEVPRSQYRTLGDRAFNVAAPKQWNSLSLECVAQETFMFLNGF